MKSKNAQIGSTVTWMVAFTVIFFIMMLYLLGVGTLAVGGKAFESKSSYEVANTETLSGQRDIIRLLNSNIEYKGEEMKFVDFFLSLGSSPSKEQIDEFLEIGADHFNKEGSTYFFESDFIKVDFFCGKYSINDISMYSYFVDSIKKYNFKFYGDYKDVRLSIYSGGYTGKC